MLLDIWNPREDEGMFPNVTRFMVENRYKATRYAISDEVTVAIADMVRDHPNGLIDNIQFALPKFETTYVEFDLALFLQRLGSRTTTSLYPNSEADKTLGFMVHKNAVATIVQGARLGPPRVVSSLYTLVDHAPPRGFIAVRIERGLGEEVQTCKELALTLGSTLINPKTKLSLERADDIVRRVSRWCDAGFARHVKYTQDGEKFYVNAAKGNPIIQAMTGSTGDIRNLWALLLWLNQSRVTYTDEVASQRQFVGGKPRAFASHKVLKLRETYKAKTISRYFSMAAFVKRAQHEVGQFFRHFDKDPTCEHEWPIMPDDRGHWHCRKCTEWMTIVREHKRGDPSVGVLTKEYRT